jgi:zinc protease
MKFHDVWYRPNNATLVVVGDTTLAELTPKLEKLFAGWKSGQIPTKNLSTVKLATEPVVYILDKPNASQSMIITGHVSAPANTPQEIAIQAMNDDLGGLFSSRLNMNLREDKHWAYGSGSFFWGARAQRPLFIYAPVQTDKTKESVLEVNKEIHGIIKDHPVTAEELARVQANETLSLPGSRETIGAVGQSILDILQYGWPDDYYATMAGKIRALKATDLDAAAKQVLHPEGMVWVIVGDRAKIEQGIKDLNIGKVRYIDANGKPI